jgi:hypothetical protein
MDDLNNGWPFSCGLRPLLRGLIGTNPIKPKTIISLKISKSRGSETLIRRQPSLLLSDLYIRLKMIMRSQPDIFHFILIELPARSEAVIIFHQNLKFSAQDL